MIITYMRLLIFSKKNEVLALQLNESGLEFMIVTAIRQKHHHASVQNDIKSANCEYIRMRVHVPRRSVGSFLLLACCTLVAPVASL